MQKGHLLLYRIHLDAIGVLICLTQYHNWAVLMSDEDE